jgi:hypothetical protein
MAMMMMKMMMMAILIMPMMVLMMVMLIVASSKKCSQVLPRCSKIEGLVHMALQALSGKVGKQLVGHIVQRMPMNVCVQDLQQACAAQSVE